VQFDVQLPSAAPPSAWPVAEQLVTQLWPDEQSLSLWQLGHAATVAPEQAAMQSLQYCFPSE